MSEKLLVDSYYDMLGCYLVLISGASEVLLEKRFRFIRFFSLPTHERELSDNF